MATRQKPWYRARNIVLLMLALVSACLGLFVYNAVTARPGRPVDYAAQIEALLLQYQPEGTDPRRANAFEFLQEVMDLHREVETELAPASGVTYIDYPSLYDPDFIDRPGLSREAHESLREKARQALALLRERGVFELLDRAAATPSSSAFKRQQGAVFTWLLPYLGECRKLARALAAAMAEAAARGDHAEVVRSYEQMLAIGRICAQQNFLIQRSVGFAVMGLANRQLAHTLTEHRLPEPALEQCLQALARQQAWRPPSRFALESDRLAYFDTVQRVYTDDARGSGRFIVTAYHQMMDDFGFADAFRGSAEGELFRHLGRIADYRVSNMAAIAFASKREVNNQIDEIIEEAIRIERLPAAARAGLAKQLEERLEDLPPRFLVLKWLVPSLRRFAEIGIQDEVLSDATRILLALELHRSRTGAYPASLSVLSPGILAAVPRDVRTDTEFGYRLLDPAQDRWRRGFLLYSFGADGEDNGGAVDSENPLRAIQPQGAGLDMVFNVPRLSGSDEQAVQSGTTGEP